MKIERANQLRSIADELTNYITTMRIISERLELDEVKGIVPTELLPTVYAIGQCNSDMLNRCKTMNLILELETAHSKASLRTKETLNIQ